MQTFAYTTKVELDHKSKNVLSGGKAVNSCKNVVNNGENLCFPILQRPAAASGERKPWLPSEGSGVSKE